MPSTPQYKKQQKTLPYLLNFKLSIQPAPALNRQPGHRVSILNSQFSIHFVGRAGLEPAPSGSTLRQAKILLKNLPSKTASHATTTTTSQSKHQKSIVPIPSITSIVSITHIRFHTQFLQRILKRNRGASSSSPPPP